MPCNTYKMTCILQVMISWFVIMMLLQDKLFILMIMLIPIILNHWRHY